MQTARDFLVKANLAKPGRGKFSNEAKEYLAEAIRDGHKFSDWDENGRVSVSNAEKNKFEKRLAPEVTPAPKSKPFVRYREETEIVFTHPKNGRIVVLDWVGNKPVWAAEKITTPSFLKEYTWELR